MFVWPTSLGCERVLGGPPLCGRMDVQYIKKECNDCSMQLRELQGTFAIFEPGDWTFRTRCYPSPHVAGICISIMNAAGPCPTADESRATKPPNSVEAKRRRRRGDLGNPALSSLYQPSIPPQGWGDGHVSQRFQNINSLFHSFEY